MLNLDQLNEHLEHYKDPHALGKLILNSITKELYLEDPKKYSKLLSELYDSAKTNGDAELRVQILYRWLDLTEYTDRDSLLALNSTTFQELLSCMVSPEVQEKSIITWIRMNPQIYLPLTLHGISCTMTDPDRYRRKYNNNKSKPDMTYIYNIYPLEPSVLIHILTSSLSYLHNLIERPLETLNDIIHNLDLNELQDTDAVKLLAMSSYIEKTNLDPIGEYYFPKKYNTLLQTAQALGVVDNPDYWMQSLQTIQEVNSSMHDIILPTLD